MVSLQPCCTVILHPIAFKLLSSKIAPCFNSLTKKQNYFILLQKIISSVKNIVHFYLNFFNSKRYHKNSNSFQFHKMVAFKIKKGFNTKNNYFAMLEKNWTWEKNPIFSKWKKMWKFHFCNHLAKWHLFLSWNDTNSTTKI